MLVYGGRSRLSERSVGRTTIMLRCKLFSAAILLLAACGRDLRFAPPIDVPGVLRNASADPAVEHFDLPLHTDFEWESLVILGPYTDQKRAEAAVGFPWRGYSRFGLEMSDSIHLLVFIRGQKIARVFEVRRCSPDFTPGDLARRIPRAATKLNIDRRTGCPTFKLTGA